MIERAVITAVGGRMNLARALPEAVPATVADTAPEAAGRVFTAEELEELERQNFRRALERCDGRVSGAQGAAQLLGLKPSTLASRLKVLGISRGA